MNQFVLAMSGIDLLIRIFEGEYVLKKAQAIAIALTMKNSRTGNTKLGGKSINMLL